MLCSTVLAAELLVIAAIGGSGILSAQKAPPTSEAIEQKVVEVKAHTR